MGAADGTIKKLPDDTGQLCFLWKDLLLRSEVFQRDPAIGLLHDEE